MSFCVERKVMDLFPGMLLVVAYGEGIDNRTARPEITAELRRAEARLRASWSYPNAQSHPHVSAWRRAMKQVSVSPSSYPSSIESLSRQVIGGRGLRCINPLVDFYNSISLQHLVPVGGWDVRGGRCLWLRTTRAGEPFTELGQREAVCVEAGEVCYADSTAVLTRHFVWRQAEQAKITAETTKFFLVSEVLPELGAEIAKAIEASLSEGVQRHFGVTPRSAVLDGGEVEWFFSHTQAPVYVYY